MIVNKLVIQCFGNITYKQFQFGSNLCVIDCDEQNEVLSALCVVLGNRLLRFQPTRYRFTQDSKINAEILVNDTTYTVKAVFDEKFPDNCYVSVNQGEVLLTDKEREGLFDTSIEEEECSYFINPYDYIRYVPFRELNYIKKLYDYQVRLNSEESKILAGLLQDYSCNILTDKIQQEQLLLSSTENHDSFYNDISIHMIGFLTLNKCQFLLNRWTKQKPLFVHVFWKCDDKSIRTGKFMEQLLSLNRQIFVFSKNKTG